ncbi:MAG: glycosyltransferase [Terriglobia bacterium]|jgi:glycosyltransferase involved in cell wall biosynthesis
MSESDPGKVSVIVPARNEEANIERVLRSLAGQRGVREILVVDDSSQDRTAEIAQALKEEIPTLRLLHVDSLPDGWLGKNYAVALAAREAAGDWLLFTDADTEHLPGSLAATLEMAEREGADLFSLSPGQITPTWWEKAVIPLVYVDLARLYKFEDVSDPASPAAAANGQYLLIRREVYERVGGHAAIHDQVLEDVELAKRVKTAGGKVVFMPGAAWVRTRMYSTFGEMWAGWSKNLYLLYGRSLGKILKSLADLCAADLLPQVFFIVLLMCLLSGRRSVIVLAGIVSSLVVILARHARYLRAVTQLGFDSRVAAWRLEGAVILSALLINSVIAHRMWHHVEWKGRRYSTRGQR